MKNLSEVEKRAIIFMEMVHFGNHYYVHMLISHTDSSYSGFL